MKRHSVLFTAVLYWFCGAVALSQPVDQATPYIRLIVPEADTLRTSSGVYRLSASTNPGRSVTINGVSYKVFPSGAFAGLLDLTVGDNLFTVQSVGPARDTVSKSFVVIRSKPLETTRLDTLAIEDAMMQPRADMWLGEGDLLRVQFKGTPRCKASFLNGIPMREMPAEETWGIAGIYRGVYKVRPEDSLLTQPITFTLEDSTGKSVQKDLRRTVLFRPRDFPMVGITKGDRPALAYGLGEDRLGGAKLSFINPGISLAITGKTGDKYRVGLAAEQEAWIDTDMVQLQPPGTFAPISLTGNMTVYGDAKYDYVSVTMSEKLPYSSLQELSPTRIHVDVYGAVSNTNWIVQRETAKEITNVYYAQIDKHVLRLTIELKHTQIWGYGISYAGNSLLITVRRQPEKLNIKALTFALDAGHGGENDGALGSTGAKEKDVNLSTVMHLKELFEDKGARVLLTRKDDTFSYNSERLRKVIEGGADILISIHANSIGSTSNPLDTKGVSTYYKHMCYRPLSTFILDAVLRTGLSRWGNVGSFNFTLNSQTELPNVLVELAFMSHPEDEIKLLDDDFRREIAEKIVDGVEDFLDECEE